MIVWLLEKAAATTRGEVEEKKREKEAQGWEGRKSKGGKEKRPPLKREWSGKDLSEFPHSAVYCCQQIWNSYKLIERMGGKVRERKK